MKLNELKIYFVFFFLCYGCGVKPNLSPKDKFKKAIEHYNNEEYGDAIALFKETLVPLLGTNEEIEVRYYIAKSYFNKREYLRAADAFADFFDTFPTSDRAEEALYNELISLYKESPYSNLDQTITYRAIDAIKFYLEEFPDGKFATEAKSLYKELQDRIEKKDLDNLKVFFDMKNYVSAVVYCDNFEKDHPDSLLLPEILFLKISSLHQLIKQKSIDREKKFLANLVNSCLAFMQKYNQDKNIASVRSVYEEIAGLG